MQSVPSAGSDKSVCKAGADPYNGAMDGLIHFCIVLLTVLFFAGLAGSAVVVVISFVEDLTELLGE